MKVTVDKRSDGSVVLKFRRKDGSEDWQKQQGPQAAFFPLHDLTHYAVETTLAIDNAFYGLVASGWSIEDTTGKGKRGPIPAEAIFVENVVGTLDTERASGSRWTAEEFNENTARFAANGGRPAPRQLTDDELARIRQRRAELFSAWQELPPGRTLVLEFSDPV
jgi:hypothetical protein